MGCPANRRTPLQWTRPLIRILRAATARAGPERPIRRQELDMSGQSGGKIQACATNQELGAMFQGNSGDTGKSLILSGW